MSEAEEPDPFNLFAGLPMFGEIAKMLQSQGPLNWDVARQTAYAIATGAASESNVDPAVRMSFEQLGRIAELQVQGITGLPTTVGGRPAELVCVTPGQWAQKTLEAYRPLMNDLATSLGRQAAIDDAEAADPMVAMMQGIGQLLGPSMLGMALGSMVGQLATRAFGQYDLPIPRSGHEMLVVPRTVDAFAEEWSLGVDELRLWVCLQELTGHAVLNVAHLRDELTRLVSAHVAGFRPDSAALSDKLSSLQFGDADAMAALQQTLGDPEVLLGAVQTPEQLAALPRLDALVSVVVGYVDHVVDQAAAHLIGTSGQIAEAVRRRRVEASPEDVFVEKLFGLTLGRKQVERGRLFVQGVIERAGAEGLQQLFASATALPTPNEVDAPGLWLARLEIDSGD
jgi:putative hydrolase